MQPCKYVISRDVVKIGDVVETGYPRPCVVWINTAVLRPAVNIAGPCSPSRTDKCERPKDGEHIVWLQYGNKKLVYKRYVVDRVFAIVRRALEESVPATVLLAGASRTGKSTLARAVLDSFGVPYEVVSGDSFLSKYVGESEKLVREFFQKAVSENRSIVFEEIDGLFPTVGRYGREGEEIVKTRTAFLAYMDEVLRSNKPIVVIATTNVDVSLFPPEVRNRFQYVEEFPQPAPAEYDLFLRLLGSENGAWVKMKALTSLAPYDAVERCVRLGFCNFEPEYVVVYTEGRVETSTDSAGKYISEVRRYVEYAQPFALFLANLKTYQDAPAGEHAVEISAVVLSAITGKPVIITRDKEEYVNIVKQAKYFNAVVAPLEETVSTADIWLAYRRVAVALLSWSNVPRGIAKITLPVDSFVIDKERAQDWVKKKVREVLDAFRRST